MQPDNKFSIIGCHRRFSLGALPGRILSRIKVLIVFVCDFSKNTEYLTEPQVCHNYLASLYSGSPLATLVHYFLCLGNFSYFYFSLGDFMLLLQYLPISRMARSDGNSVPNFLRNCHVVFHNKSTIYIPSNSTQGFQRVFSLSGWCPLKHKTH